MSNASSVKVCENLRNYVKSIGYEAHFVLLQLIEEVLDEPFAGMLMSDNSKLQFSRSTYVSDMKCPTADDIQRCGKVHINEVKHRVV